ncbi:unnamed protein product [Caenorhabditis sp. 36 PRJEB53466]|nr:unnamed protein product [Caenorhabditis sp. 36 PRJEB53466]
MVVSDRYTHQSITPKGKIERFRAKFVRLRENLKFLLAILLKNIPGYSEDEIQKLQIMLLKTTFFTDEMDFHLRGEIPFEVADEVDAAYFHFYQRSRTEVTGLLHELCPDHYFIW